MSLYQRGLAVQVGRAGLYRMGLRVGAIWTPWDFSNPQAVADFVRTYKDGELQRTFWTSNEPEAVQWRAAVAALPADQRAIIETSKPGATLPLPAPAPPAPIPPPPPPTGGGLGLGIGLALAGLVAGGVYLYSQKAA